MLENAVRRTNLRAAQVLAVAAEPRDYESHGSVCLLSLEHPADQASAVSCHRETHTGAALLEIDVRRRDLLSKPEDLLQFLCLVSCQPTDSAVANVGDAQTTHRQSTMTGADR